MTRFSPGAFLQAALLTAGIGLGLQSCGWEPLASSEIGNPPSKGVVVGLVGTPQQPSAGVEIRLFPVEFNPVQDSSRAPLRYRDTTDAKGAFSLAGVDTGVYNIEARDPSAGTMLLMRDVHVRSRDTAHAEGGPLRKPGAVSMHLPDYPSTAGAYVFIRGTGAFQRLEDLRGESPTVVLEPVPAGPTPAIVYATGTKVAELWSNVPVLPGDTAPAGTYPLWPRAARIFVNTASGGSGAGAGTAANVDRFTLLVNLGGSGSGESKGLDFDFSRATADGRDIRFADKAGNPLPFEIEEWDSAASRASIWVKAGTVLGNDSSQFIRMYWGNGAAQPLAPAGVLDSALSYGGAWHMQPTDAGTITDASRAGNPILLQGESAPAATAAGVAGRAVSLDGQPRMLTTGRSANSPQTFSISLWFNTATDSGGKLIGFGSVQGIDTGSRDRHIWMDDTGHVHFAVFPTSDPPNRKVILTAPGAYNDGKWHYVAGVLSPAGTIMYMDGVKVGEDTNAAKAQYYTGYWRLGFDFPFNDWPFPPSARYFKGVLDEARVSYKAFSADWFRLSYENQRPGGKMLRIQSE